MYSGAFEASAGRGDGMFREPLLEEGTRCLWRNVEQAFLLSPFVCLLKIAKLEWERRKTSICCWQVNKGQIIFPAGTWAPLVILLKLHHAESWFWPQSHTQSMPESTAMEDLCCWKIFSYSPTANAVFHSVTSDPSYGVPVILGASPFFECCGCKLAFLSLCSPFVILYSTTLQGHCMICKW